MSSAIVQFAIDTAMALEMHIEVCPLCHEHVPCEECRRLILEWQDASSAAFIASCTRGPPNNGKVGL